MSRPVDKQWKMIFGYGVPYGPALAHLTKDGKHHGFDYACPIGTKVLNPVFGVLVEMGEKQYMGRYMIIKFQVLQGLAKSTFRFTAMHLSKIMFSKVMPTTTIAKGELLALSGDTGTYYSKRTHPHLHAQIDKWDSTAKKWVDVDPSFIFGKG